MTYVPLRLEHNKLNAAIAMFTEGYLEQAHYLLAANRPQGGLGKSAAVMTLLAIAAASRLRIFDLVKNDKRADISDRDAFIGCVREFFPWSDVTIEDDQHRTRDAVRDAAAVELYKVFRNPLVHTGGVTAKAHLSGKIADWYRTPQIVHVFPGRSPEENECYIAELCNTPLAGDMLIELAIAAHNAHKRDQASAEQLKSFTRGQNMIAVPDEKATDADWARVHAALGRPAKADAYQLKLKDNMVAEKHFVDFAKGLFFDAGLSPKQAQRAFDRWQTYAEERATAYAAEREADQAQRVESLKRSWGPSWDSDIAAGQKVLEVIGLTHDELSELESAVALGPGLKALARVGQLMTKGDGKVTSDGKTTPTTTVVISTPEQAKARIAELSGDKAWQDGLRDRRNPRRAQQLAEWESLHAQAFPSQR